MRGGERLREAAPSVRNGWLAKRLGWLHHLRKILFGKVCEERLIVSEYRVRIMTNAIPVRTAMSSRKTGLKLTAASVFKWIRS